METIRYAVVGCGAIAGNYHLPALVATEAAEFVVACDILADRARATAEKFGAPDRCADYREVTSRDDVDLVCIFTKIDSHAELAIAAAKAGKHVFIQKPFARSISEGRAMAEAARRAGVELIPAFMHHYLDESLAAAELVQEGMIGAVEFMRQRNGTMNPRATAPSYGGALMDIGAHGIDLIRALTGQEIVRVSARLDEQPGSAAYDEALAPEDRELLGGEINAWMHYELSEGALVSHEVQWSQRAGTSRFQTEVYGTEGTLFVRVPRTGADLAYASTVGLAEREKKRVDWFVPELPGRAYGQAHHETLIRSLLTGDGSAQTAEDGLAVLRVCEAARRSAATGCWVEVL